MITGLVSGGGLDKISSALDEANQKESWGLWKDKVKVRIRLLHTHEKGARFNKKMV
jgi:hypothetical protein